MRIEQEGGMNDDTLESIGFALVSVVVVLLICLI